MRYGEPLDDVVARTQSRGGKQPATTTHDERRAQLERARLDGAGAKRRRVGEILASLAAAEAIDSEQADALVQVLTDPTTNAHNAVERFSARRARTGAGTGAAIASLYERTMGR